MLFKTRAYPKILFRKSQEQILIELVAMVAKKGKVIKILNCLKIKSIIQSN